jgi:hypothetical protein
LRGTANAAFIVDRLLVPEVVRAHPEIKPPVVSHKARSLDGRKLTPGASATPTSATGTLPPLPTAPGVHSGVVTQAGHSTADGTPANTAVASTEPMSEPERASEEAEAVDMHSQAEPSTQQQQQQQQQQQPQQQQQQQQQPKSRELILLENPVAAAENRAFRLYQRAAALQDAVALLRIGDYHYYGKAGLAPSADKAASYYKMSTEQGKNSQVQLSHRCCWREQEFSCIMSACLDLAYSGCSVLHTCAHPGDVQHGLHA